MENLVDGPMVTGDGSSTNPRWRDLGAAVTGTVAAFLLNLGGVAVSIAAAQDLPMLTALCLSVLIAVLLLCRRTSRWFGVGVVLGTIAAVGFVEWWLSSLP